MGDECRPAGDERHLEDDLQPRKGVHPRPGDYLPLESRGLPRRAVHEGRDGKLPLQDGGKMMIAP